MTNGQRTVTTMLAAVAVMLGLNLIVRGSPRAVAAPPVPEPTVVGVTMTHQPESPPRDLLVRVWSDGLTEQNTRRRLQDSGAWSGWELVPE